MKLIISNEIKNEDIPLKDNSTGNRDQWSSNSSKITSQQSSISLSPHHSNTHGKRISRRETCERDEKVPAQFTAFSAHNKKITNSHPVRPKVKKSVYPEDFKSETSHDGKGFASIDKPRRASDVKEHGESKFYQNFLPRNGASSATRTRSNWNTFAIVLSVTCSYFVTGPPRREWSFLYTVAVLTSKRIMEQMLGDPEPALLEHQRRQLFKPARIPKSAKIIIEYFNTKLKAVNYFRQNSPGEWPNFAANIGPIHGEFISSGKSDDTSVILTLHGGMHISGSAQVYRSVNYNLSQASGSIVFAINYRLAPLNPYPCGMIDALTAYLYLIEQKKFNPSRIIISGDSAGAGMAIALTYVIRDMGLPSPGGLYLMSPWLDLTHSQESYHRNNSTDGIPKSSPSDPRLGDRLHYYTENRNLKDGYVSPFFQSNLKNLPPLLIQCGSAEKLCDEAVVFSEKISREDHKNLVILEVYQAHVHCFQFFEWFKGPQNATTRAGVWIHNLLHGRAPEQSAHVFLDFRGREYGRTPFLKSDRFSSVIPALPLFRCMLRKKSSFVNQEVEVCNRQSESKEPFGGLKDPIPVQKITVSSSHREPSALFLLADHNSSVDMELKAQAYLMPCIAISKN